MKAEEFHDLASAVVISCENVDSMDRQRSGLADDPGVHGDGSVSEALDNGFDDVHEHFIALANLLNELSTELFDREQLCIQYTADLQNYLADCEEWDEVVQLSNTINIPPWRDPPPSSPPPPPFVGAEASL